MNLTAALSTPWPCLVYLIIKQCIMCIVRSLVHPWLLGKSCYICDFYQVSFIEKMPAERIETENGYKTYYSQDDSKLVTLAKINKILIIITLISSFLAIILAVAAAIAIPFIVQHFQSEDTGKLLNYLQDIKNSEDTEKILN